MINKTTMTMIPIMISIMLYLLSLDVVEVEVVLFLEVMKAGQDARIVFFLPLFQL